MFILRGAPGVIVEIHNVHSVSWLLPATPRIGPIDCWMLKLQLCPEVIRNSTLSEKDKKKKFNHSYEFS